MIGRRVRLAMALLLIAEGVGAQEPADTAAADTAAVESNATRLMFGPTARPVRAGTGYVGLFEFLPFVAFGLTDQITFAAGTPIIPGATGAVVYAAPKVGVALDENVHVAAGVLALFSGEGSESVGVAYGVGTWGAPTAALTVGAGWPFVTGDEIADSPVILLGGELGGGGRQKLITENYFVPGESGMIGSFGMRFSGRRFATDVGIGAWLGESPQCCLPLLNFVYSFGGGA